MKTLFFKRLVSNNISAIIRLGICGGWWNISSWFNKCDEKKLELVIDSVFHSIIFGVKKLFATAVGNWTEFGCVAFSKLAGDIGGKLDQRVWWGYRLLSIFEDVLGWFLRFASLEWSFPVSLITASTYALSTFSWFGALLYWCWCQDCPRILQLQSVFLGRNSASSTGDLKHPLPPLKYYKKVKQTFCSEFRSCFVDVGSNKKTE